MSHLSLSNEKGIQCEINEPLQSYGKSHNPNTSTKGSKETIRFARIQGLQGECKAQDNKGEHKGSKGYKVFVVNKDLSQIIRIIEVD